MLFVDRAETVMTQLIEEDGIQGALALKNQILENLRSGRWIAGQKLPTERKLSETFQIGRSTVRRVLAQLKAKGLLRQSVGSGTYVADEIEKTISVERAATVNVSPADLMEARLVLEPSLVELIVRNATAADFAEMERCCDEAEAATSLELFEYWDGALHRQIAAAAHNNFVLDVFESMNRVRATGEWGAMKRKSVTPERRAAYQVEHRAIVRALKDRDIDQAREATLDHLVHVRKNLLGY
ncbi:transcriptional regulator, GntR family [Cupriavidus sp. YR651]|uniref:FadR/GntR family transcriptional regulator n=1 Tax=Cupriavidus sp. YR651 TaxID=1855315 RepID=UPI00088301CF|nr:FCD domain-containing protein [Cupriavidus sp. YR651]SDC98061.1 transcriptional regulator, GntR family [Cupriavidus sp. YR651]